MGKRTGRITVAAFVVAAAFCCGTTAAYAASLTVGNARGGPGTQVQFPISIATDGQSIAGTQNDIAFDPVNTPIATKKTCSVTQSQTCTTNGDCPQGGTGGIPPAETCVDRPDCTVTSTINKQVYLSFQPAGCSGTACTAIRVIVVKVEPDSTDPTKPTADSLDAIPVDASNSAVLAKCKANNSPTATLGQEYPLTTTAPILSDPTGAALASVTGNNGKIVVGCIGDLASGTPATENGVISNSEALKAISGLLTHDVTKNPSADADFNGVISNSEALKVISNLLNHQCK